MHNIELTDHEYDNATVCSLCWIIQFHANVSL